MSDVLRDYSFGGWLRSFRIKRNLTMRATAKLLKMDIGNYSRLEASRVSPPRSFKNLKRLTDPLGLTDKEFSMLVFTAYNFYLGKLHETWREPTPTEVKENLEGAR